MEFLTCNTLRKQTKDKSSRYDKIVDISKVKLVLKNTREFLINNQVQKIESMRISTCN